MKLAFHLILHTIITFTFAGTVQFCTGLEGPSLWNGQSMGFNVTVHDENSTVLIFESSDIAWELEGYVDLSMLIKAVGDGTYPICSHSTEDYQEHQFCHSMDNFGLFDQDIVLDKKIFWPVTAARLSPGESQSYTAPSAGAYCVLIHQENAEVVDLDGIDIEVTHPYGDFELTFTLLCFKLGAASQFLFFFHFIVIRLIGFPNTRREYRYGFWKLLNLTIKGKLAVWLMHRFFLQYVWQSVLHLGGPVYPVLQLNPWVLCDHAISLGLISVMFAVLNGLFCKYIKGIYYCKYNYCVEGWEFASRRSYWAIVTTIVVSSLGRILVQHIVESASLTVLMMDIDASLVALILSMLDHSRQYWKYIDAVRCTNCARAKEEGGPRDYLHVASRVEQRSKDTYIAQLSGKPSRHTIEVTPWPQITLLLVLWAVYLLMDIAGALGYHLGLPYVNQYRLSKMAYHHFIGLNTLLNWIYSGIVIICGWFPSIIVNDAA